jgi:hypothetical protein
VVVGELVEAAVAEDVGARIADVAERDLPVGRDEGGGDRRPHPARGRVGRGAVVDAAIRLLDQLRDALLATAVPAGLAERRRGEA